jgi:hypothetical protein
VVGQQRALDVASPTNHPDHVLAAPMTRMETGADPVEEDHSRSQQATTAIGERMARAVSLRASFLHLSIIPDQKVFNG